MGASARQFDLLAPQRQLTIDGREEPLVAAPASMPGGSREEKDTRTAELPFSAEHQLEIFRQQVWVQACEERRWHLPLWNAQTGEFKRVCWRCRSWRHQGECARWVAKRDFARISEALDGYDPKDMVYVVLTLAQDKETSRGLDAARAYATVARRWQSLRQWIERHYGRVGYVGTIEQHRSGWPHLNLIIANEKFAEAIRASAKPDGKAPHWLKSPAVRCGFGYQAWAEPPRDVQQLAGYIVKLAHRETLTGEVTKLSQLPLMAPPGTRRLRSSWRFLPPAHKGTGEWTGELVRHSVAEAERLEAEHRKRAAEQWEQTADWLRREFERQLGPLSPPKSGAGAEPQVEPGSGAKPRLDTTGTTPSAGPRRPPAGPSTPLPEALAGADPPDGWRPAAEFAVSSA
jgi:hypothetical protein